jgi:flagellar motility protein MotE (MotC chaperone)
LEEKLQLEKLALGKKVEELEIKRRDIASKLEGRVQEDEESVKKLVDMYSNMKPQSAAQVIASLDDELAINILKRMKKQEAGSILNYMPPQKAKLLSEKYTGY